MRILAAMLLGMISLAGGARAGEIPGSVTMVGGWRLSAYENAGKFSYCDVAIPYRSGTIMGIAMASDASWRIVWAYPDARFAVGENVALQLYVDGAGPYRVTANAKMRTVVMTELAPLNDFFNAVRTGKELVVVSARGKQVFELNGTSAALNQVAACTRRYSRAPSVATAAPAAPAVPAPAPAPAPAPPPATASPGGGSQVAGLPLQRGYYVQGQIACGEASAPALVLHTRDGVNGNTHREKFLRIEKTGPTTYRVDTELTSVQTLTSQGGQVSRWVSTYDVDSPTSYRINHPGGSTLSYRFCAQAILPEPWRSNNITDVPTERGTSSAGQQQAGSVPAPAAPAPAATPPDQRIEKINFVAVKDPAATGITYPFMKPRLAEFAGDPGPPLIGEAHGLNKVNVVMLRKESQVWCGSHGCNMTVYADEGGGFKEAAGLIVHQPIYLLSTATSTSLIFCSLQGGYLEWELKNHAFKLKGPFKPASPLACS
jgi:hypothetical protein